MHRSTPVAVVITGGLLLAGCGAGAPAADVRRPVEKAADAPRPERVRILDFEYEPRRLVVAKGTRVEWINRDAANHTVTFRARRPGDLGNVDEDKRLDARFTRTGRFPYVCIYHPGMRAIVVVR